MSLWRCLLICCLIVRAYNAQIVFQTVPLNNTIAQGSPVTFQCQVESSVLVSLRWRHNNVDIAYDGRVQMRVADGVFELRINHTVDGDDGNYSCVATVHSSGEEHTRKAYLQFAFIMPQFLRHPESKMVMLGNTAQFFCIQDTSLPLAAVTWLKDGTPLQVSSSSRLIVQSEELSHDIGRVSSSLAISPVMISDDGVYRCRAVNPLLPDSPVFSNNATLTVQIPLITPSFLENPSSIILRFEGQQASFNCSATGSPAPTITWLHNDNIISDSIAVSTGDQMTNSTLTISNVLQRNTGSYQCRADNDVSSVTSTTATLSIAMISQEFQVQPPDNILAVLGETTTIPCGPPTSIPPADVQWTKDHRLLFGDRFVVNGNNLSVIDTQLSDRGLYYCTATNPLTLQSVISQGANITVRVGPVFTQLPTNTTAPVTGSSSFTCQVSGDPAPTISWYRNQTLITGTDSRFVVAGGNLMIDPIMLSDDGSFTCEATNIAGTIQSVAYLNVQYPPEISSTFITDVVATVGDEVLLHCSAVANPIARITWLFNSAEVDGVLTNGSLLLSIVQVTNEGNYTCRATNSIGSDEADVFLSILVPAVAVVGEDNVTVVEGQPVNLTCQATGDPPPIITWYDDDGNLITQDDRVTISEGFLSLSSTQKSDEGAITCVAANSVGNSTTSTDLRVLVTPRITQADNSDVILVESGTLLLHCSASGDPAPDITWEVPSYTENNGTDRLLMYRNGSLAVYGVHDQDEGLYQCVAENEAGSDTVNVTLSVLVPARAQTADSHTATRTRNGILNCVVSGDPEPAISWLRNETQLTNGAKYMILENGSLWIRNIADSDTGDYSCLATNEAGSDTATTTLIVYVIPVVVIPRPVRFGVMGQSLVLECSTSGFPPPTITWQFNSRQIIPGGTSRLSITPEGNLIVNDIVVNDDGLYQCVATNAAGSDFGVVNLTIYVSPSVQATVDSVTTVEGDTVTLSCTATGIPQPTIEWELNDVAVTTQGSRLVVGSGDLTFAPVANNDEGSYMCVARNIVGFAEASITLTVYVRPSIIQDPVNTTVSEGNIATLTCIAAGDPSPMVSWSFNNQTVVEGFTTLTISMTTRSNTGYYTCTAINSVGVSSSTAYLDVFYIPSITQGPASATIPENASVSFTCQADANPPADFQWLRNNQRFTSNDPGVSMSNGRLMITMASAFHAGEIACVASNVEGTTSSLATLTVLFPPTAPLNVTATVLSATSVSLTWSHPSSDGGVDITNYIITYRSSAEDQMTVETNSVSLTIELFDLTPYTAYEFLASAENAIGTGPASVTVQAMTLVGAPSMPRSFNVSSSTATSVTLTWMSPDPFNGPMSTVYQLLYNRENSTSSPNSRQIFGLRTTISGLQADVTYVFSVRGSTFDGDGVLIWGEYSTIRVLNGMVLAPIIPTSSSTMIMPSSTSISSSSSSSSSPIVVFTSSSTTTSSPAVVSSSTMTTTSSVMIMTTTTTTTTIPSSSSIITTMSSSSVAVNPTPVLPPSTTPQWIVVLALQRGMVFLQWTITDTSSVEGFMISITPPPPTSPSSRNVTTTTILTLSGLADYTNYTFTVAAYNTGGVGPASLTRSVLTNEGVPSAPRDVSVQITSISSVLVTWQPPEATNGVLDSYIVRIMAGLSTTPLLSRIVNAEGETTGGSAVIRGLELGSYTVTVVAETGAGEGDPSAPLTFTLMTTTSISSSTQLVTTLVPVTTTSISSIQPTSSSSSVNTALPVTTTIVSTTTTTTSNATTTTATATTTAATSTPITTANDTSVIERSSSQVIATTTIMLNTTTTSVIVPTTIVDILTLTSSVTTSTLSFIMTASPTVGVSGNEDDSAVLEGVIPAVVVVIIILLVVALIGWLYWRRKSSTKAQRYLINSKSSNVRQRVVDDKIDLIPLQEEDEEYFSAVREALQDNFAYSSDGNNMNTFGDHINDIPDDGPPVIPEDELEDSSSEDEFDGPYATADQVQRREKRNATLKKLEDSLEETTDSNRSSNVSGTYVSSDSIRAKKVEDRANSLRRAQNESVDDDTGLSPLPAGQRTNIHDYTSSDIGWND